MYRWHKTNPPLIPPLAKGGFAPKLCLASLKVRPPLIVIFVLKLSLSISKGELKGD